MGMELPSPTSPALARAAEAAASTSQASTSGSRQRALALMQQKESIQSEMDVQFSTLRANQSTMQTPLLDSDGFPRADIDVFAVRTARVRIIELRNDLEKVRGEIAQALEGCWEPVTLTSSGGPGSKDEARVNGGDTREPFARVDGVFPQSPASDAGLKRDDLILAFGPLSTLTRPTLAQDLAPLAAVTQDHQNHNMTVIVRREGEQKHLVLRPRTGWGGRGMLGCHIVPYRP